MNSLFLLLLVLFLVAGFVLAALNLTPQVTVNLLFREYLDVPLGTVMIGSMIAGMGMATVLGVFEVVRLRTQCRQLRRRIRALEGAEPPPSRLDPGRGGEPLRGTEAGEGDPHE